MTEAAPVLPGVDDSGDCQDEGTPMQTSVHSSSLNLQLSLNYQYCLIPQHFPLIPLILCAPHKHMLLIHPHQACGCKLADGKPCSTLFSREYFTDARAQSFLLSREQLDMLLLGSIASTGNATLPVVRPSELLTLCKQCPTEPSVDTG